MVVTGFEILCINSVWNPSKRRVLRASVAKMSGWKGGLEPGKC